MEAGPIFSCTLYTKNYLEKLLWFYWSDVMKHIIQYMFKKRGCFPILISCEVDRFIFHPIYYIKKKHSENEYIKLCFIGLILFT